MKVYADLRLAISEIQRDVYKGPVMDVTRVQQRDGLNLVAHELLGYAYNLLPGAIPDDAEDIVNLGASMGFKIFEEHTGTMVDWLEHEALVRLGQHVTSPDSPSELDHPALVSTLEGRYPSYTYENRLEGAVAMMVRTLMDTKDSRRALWSIWQPEDSLRARHPTRVPCSMYYQLFIREVNGVDQLEMVYNMRSSDFDTFFLSDVWLANQFQLQVLQRLRATYYPKLQLGNFIHMITSLHSFKVHDQEIY